MHKSHPRISEPFEKKVVKQLFLCTVLALALLLIKGIPVSGGMAGDYAKTVLNHTTDVPKTAKDIMGYAEQKGLLPPWAKKSEPAPSQSPDPLSNTTGSPTV